MPPWPPSRDAAESSAHPYEIEFARTELLEQATRRLSLDRRSAPTDTDVDILIPRPGPAWAVPCSAMVVDQGFHRPWSCLAGKSAENRKAGLGLMAMVRQHRTQCDPASPLSLSLSRVVVFHSSIGVKTALMGGMGTLVRPVLMVWGPLNYVLHEILPDSMRGTGTGTGMSAGTGTLHQAKPGRRIIPVDWEGYSSVDLTMLRWTECAGSNSSRIESRKPRCRKATLA